MSTFFFRVFAFTFILASCASTGLSSCTFADLGRTVAPDEVYVERAFGSYAARNGDIEDQTLVVGVSWAIGPREVFVSNLPEPQAQVIVKPQEKTPEPKEKPEEEGGVLIPASVLALLATTIIGALRRPSQ